MKTYFFAVLALAASSISASAITVVTPSNGAVLTSPFKLVASTSTCGGIPAVSMGYSIDSNTATIEPTSFSALVVASPGSHVLHVKCWGKQINAQLLYNITVVAATPASATSSITVASPANGATLSSPFSLVANTKTCASVPAVSMGYSIDSGPVVIEPTSFIASVSASAGTHTLHVKCWGQNAADQVLLAINVGVRRRPLSPRRGSRWRQVNIQLSNMYLSDVTCGFRHSLYTRWFRPFDIVTRLRWPDPDLEFDDCPGTGGSFGLCKQRHRSSRLFNCLFDFHFRTVYPFNRDQSNGHPVND